LLDGRPRFLDFSVVRENADGVETYCRRVHCGESFCTASAVRAVVQNCVSVE
jgi:hypothetical protein